MGELYGIWEPCTQWKAAPVCSSSGDLVPGFSLPWTCSLLSLYHQKALLLGSAHRPFAKGILYQGLKVSQWREASSRYRHRVPLTVAPISAWVPSGPGSSLHKEKIFKKRLWFLFPTSKITQPLNLASFCHRHFLPCIIFIWVLNSVPLW